MWYMIYYILHMIYYMWYMIYYIWYIIYYILFILYCILFTIYYILDIIYYILYIVYYILDILSYILNILFFILYMCVCMYMNIHISYIIILYPNIFVGVQLHPIPKRSQERTALKHVYLEPASPAKVTWATSRSWTRTTKKRVGLARRLQTKVGFMVCLSCPFS